MIESRNGFGLARLLFGPFSLLRGLGVRVYRVAVLDRLLGGADLTWLNFQKKKPTTSSRADADEILSLCPVCFLPDSLIGSQFQALWATPTVGCIS